jgi:hypothetical protein
MAGMAPNVADDGKFAPVAVTGFGGRRLHLLRIGQISARRNRESNVKPADCVLERGKPFAHFDDLPCR